MLTRAVIKVSLREPRSKFLEMMELLKSFGTIGLHLTHVYSGPESQLQGKREQLDALADEVRQLGFDVATLVTRGRVSLRTVAAAREAEADYIGIYWLPKPLLAQAFVGSHDADILRLSDIPVFVYNRDLMGGAEKITRALYATDFQSVDSKIIPYLQNKSFEAEELILLHVGERAPDPETEQQRKKRVQDRLDKLAEALRHCYADITTLEVVGDERKQILRQANIHKVDLIIVGKADKPKPFKYVLGSVAEALPDKSKRSVFIVPGHY